MEGDRAAVEPQRHDARDVELGQPVDHGAVKTHARRRHEAGAVRPARPTERVEAEGLLQRRLQLGVCSGDRHLESPQSGELTSPPPVQAARLRRRLLLVDRRPVRKEIENGSLDPDDHLEAARPERVDDPTPEGNAVQVDEVVIRGGQPRGQQSGHRVVGIGREQQVRQHRLPAAHESHDTHSSLADQRSAAARRAAGRLAGRVHRGRSRLRRSGATTR